MLTDEQKRDLSKVRLEHAEECLQEAEDLLSTQKYKGAANRAYYAVFHAMRSVLALDAIDRRHHSGVISEFMRLYIKTGIFDKTFSKIINGQFEYRTSSDYDDFFIISQEEAARQIVQAQRFLATVKDYLKIRQQH